MKKILYIDNKQYGHNADIHIDFISSLDDRKNFKIFGYGNHLSGYIKNFEKIPLKSSNKKFNRHEDIDVNNSNKKLDSILKSYKPDLILTYNSNGSSYEVELDNIHWYSWLSEYLSHISLPKYHITTDYCRDGYRQDQADWFKYVGYSGAFFRTKESLKYSLEIPKYWLPFSVRKDLYTINLNNNIKNKKNTVGFVGAAHNSSKSLYKQRIMAIDYLKSKNLLRLTDCLDHNCHKRKVLLGKKYIKFLTENLFNLTCGGTSNYMTAKYFQIPAAYSLLICTETNGLEIFPKDTYIKYNINNLELLYNSIIYHINNKKETEHKIRCLNNYIMSFHTHEYRLCEFYNLIK